MEAGVQYDEAAQLFGEFCTIGVFEEESGNESVVKFKN